eukprot:2945689-Rhodomonas_salina.4
MLRGWPLTADERACARRNNNARLLMAQAGADVEVPDRQGSAALLLAARQGCARTAEALLDHGARVDAVDRSVPRHDCCEDGGMRDVGMVMVAMSGCDAGGCCGLSPGDAGRLLASGWSQRTAVGVCGTGRVFYRFGERRSWYGWTPLMWAARRAGERKGTAQVCLGPG